jgi:RecB family exonuclease
MMTLDLDMIQRTITSWWPKSEPALVSRRALVPLPEETPTATVAQESSEIASVLSPSQVRCFSDCQAKWMYKYLLGYEERRSSALGLGSAFHDAVADNFRQKIDTKQDLPADTIEGLFRACWSDQLQQCELDKDEDADDLESMGAAMVTSYMENVAPLIQPAQVEVAVRGEIGGVTVQGKIDVIDVAGRIIDSKTAAKKPSGVQPDYRFQVATYVQLHPSASGEARVDTVTKTKTIATHSATVQIGDTDKLQTARLYPLAQEAMRSGLYMPNRGSNLCSRKHCSFWRQCEAEYGGCVDER